MNGRVLHDGCLLWMNLLSKFLIGLGGGRVGRPRDDVPVNVEVDPFLDELGHRDPQFVSEEVYPVQILGADPQHYRDF